MNKESTTLKNFIFFIIMISISLVISLLIFFGYFTFRTYKNPFKKINIRYLGGFQFEGDKETGYRDVRNAAITEEFEGGNYHIYTDKRGARVNSKGQQTPENIGIMTLGCSFSYGYRVENPETFTEVLGREFNVPVANFALPGYSSLQCLQMLKNNLDLKPKVIVYGFITDHIRRNLSPCALNNSAFCRATSYVDFAEGKKPYIHSPRFELFNPAMLKKFDEEVTYHEGIGFKDVLWRMRIDLHHFQEWEKMKYPNDPLSRKVSLTYVINEMSREAKKIGAKLIIVYLPLFGKGYIEPPPQELLDCLNDDIIFIDLSLKMNDYYKENDKPALTLTGDYAHPGTLGHQFVAKEVAKIIRDKNLLK